MTKNLRTTFWLLLGSVSLLSGCAVYVPTVPGTPLLRQKGEVEVTAAVRSAVSLEAGAAWSPAPHLLLLGDVALQTSEGEETYNRVTTSYHNRHWQGNLGAGTYRLLGKAQTTYLGVLGGVGYATVNVYSVDSVQQAILYILPVPFASPSVHYEASYWRCYGQSYVAHLGPARSYGLSVRGTLVSFRQTQRDGAAIDVPTRFYVEPTLFLRVGRRALQGIVTAGVSAPLEHGSVNLKSFILAPTSSLFSLGVVARPHLFRRR